MLAACFLLSVLCYDFLKTDALASQLLLRGHPPFENLPEANMNVVSLHSLVVYASFNSAVTLMISYKDECSVKNFKFYKLERQCR